MCACYLRFATSRLSDKLSCVSKSLNKGKNFYSFPDPLCPLLVHIGFPTGPNSRKRTVIQTRKDKDQPSLNPLTVRLM